MHLASRLVQNDHTDRPRRPFHPLDKRYRGGGVPRVGVHFSNDRPRSVEELHCRTLAVTTPTVARTFATPDIFSRYRASTAAFPPLVLLIFVYSGLPFMGIRVNPVVAIGVAFLL